MKNNVNRKDRINQGDLFWIALDDKNTINHPHVVIQEDLLNHSRLETVVLCALTSNLQRAKFPGNVLLDLGEGNLPKHSIVEVSKVITIRKDQLGAYIGSLPRTRIKEIKTGMRFVEKIIERNTNIENTKH